MIKIRKQSYLTVSYTHLDVYKRQVDGRLEKTQLYYLIKEKCKLENDYDIITFINKLNHDRTSIASLAKLNGIAAKDNDKYALQIYKAVSYTHLINPDKDIGSQWIYLRPVNGEFVVDEEDIKTYNDKGRKEAYEAYQKKFEKLGLTSELLAKWTIIQFNQNTRTDLIKNIQKDAYTVLTKIKENGYNYEKDNKGRQIIRCV